MVQIYETKTKTVMYVAFKTFLVAFL